MGCELTRLSDSKALPIEAADYRLFLTQLNWHTILLETEKGFLKRGKKKSVAHIFKLIRFSLLLYPLREDSPAWTATILLPIRQVMESQKKGLQAPVNDGNFKGE